MAQWNNVDSELEQIIDIAARLKGSVGGVKREVDNILLTKDAELKAFESSFFPAGGAPRLANIPPAPPAPSHLNNVRSRPLNLKTRNWGNKLENGYSGINRSLYDRPNVFYWDSRPLLTDKPSNKNIISNTPQAPRLPQWNNVRSDNLIRGKKLRTRSWGNHVEPFGWSGMDRELYNREGGLNLELNVIINELWATLQPRTPIGSNVTERGVPQVIQQPLQFIQQPQFIQLQPQPVKSSMISTVTRVVPLPLNNTNMGTATILSAAEAALPYNRIPTQKELKQQQKLLRKQNRREAKLVKKGVHPPTIAAAPVVPITRAVPMTSVQPVVLNNYNSNGLIADRGIMNAGGLQSTGIIGPVATVVGGSPALGGFNSTNAFIKQDPFINTTSTLPLAVGSPMM